MSSDEATARMIQSVSDIFTQLECHWFVAFGALLYFIRDKKMGVEFDTDMDIAVRQDEVSRSDIIGKMYEYGYELQKEVLDNHSRKPLQMVFVPNGMHAGVLNTSIDVFFWVIGERYAWHTYDTYGKNQPILDSYTFKGTPKKLITGPTIQYVWEEIACPLNFPSKYGSLLDIWYPPTKDAEGKYVQNTGWLYPNRQYGQSRSAMTKTVQSCKGMGELG